MSDGWAESASAWIADMGDKGDFGRAYVLDRPMLERVAGGSFTNALDVGCGEGRFCRMLAERGIRTVGIDPTKVLIDEAKRRHPKGEYRIGRGEQLDFPDASFDLVVSYLSLIDIPDLAPAITEMARVLRPGGALLIANLTSFDTAAQRSFGARFGIRPPVDHYLVERAEWVSWRGIRIQNWHRPLSMYMALLLDAGLELRHFAEPSPHAGDSLRIALYRRAPWFLIMEWQKPGAAIG
ncbi:MAG: class I SAM-dependent methyltransferase [Sphingomonas sp.]